jgi:hypothetical protein
MTIIATTEGRYEARNPVLGGERRGSYSPHAAVGHSYVVVSAPIDPALHRRARMVLARARAAERLHRYPIYDRQPARTQEDDDALTALYRLQLRDMPGNE